MTLTSQQASIITATVPILAAHGRHITDVFYENLLREVPELNSVFNQANQANGRQSQALATAVYAYAANINNLDVLKPALERISQKHASLYIRPEQYEIVGKYLLAAMQQVLGAALTPEILDAWKAAYGQLADVMIGREAKLYDEAEGWTDWRDMKIVKKVQESEEVTSFYLEPCDGKALPAFLPGQYISVQTEVPELKYLQARQYSLSGAPRPEHYRISVKRERGLDARHPDAPAHPGYVSNILHNYKEVGDTVQVSRPAGEFFLNVTDESDKAPVVLLSAGVGLTPLMSILETLDAYGDRRKISWVHATRNSRLHAFGEHVRAMASRNGHVRKGVFHSSPGEAEKKGEHYDFEGRMDLDKLDSRADLMLDQKDARYYICGPELFMADLEKALRGRGVAQERINMEVFGTGDLLKA
jgi:nitric oxide dioxygenase